jgi:cell division protein FtsB
VILVVLSIAAAGSAFVTHLALRFQNVAIGYRVQSARDEAARLREQINQLNMRIAADRSPQALEQMGRSQLGMVEPDRVTTIVAGSGIRPPRLSGRPR